MKRIFLILAAAVVVVPAANAQAPVTVRGTAVYESYKFGPGLVFNKVAELTVPVGVDVRLGRLGALALSSGYASVELKSTDLSQLQDQKLTGLLDTEVRLSIDVVPGKLVLIANGAVPTGIKTVQQEQLAILGAISSDVIGFSASNLGTGGNVGGGFVGALPLGNFALGFGATYKQSLSYQPLSGQSSRLQPGSEIRFRGGLEGALARRTFLRFAGIYAQSTPDKVAGSARNGVGTRMIGYASLNHGLGPASITVYGFDVYRGGPQIEQTAVGAAYLPKGNLLAAGARVDLTVAPRTMISPRAEFRASSAAADTASATLQRLGSSIRFGADIRQDLRRGVVAVLQAGGVTGDVFQAASKVSITGMRVALSVEIAP